MINLYCDIEASLQDVGDTGLVPGEFYRVIGTYHRSLDKDGKTVDQDFLILLKSDGIHKNIFPSKCKIRRSMKERVYIEMLEKQPK